MSRHPARRHRPCRPLLTAVLTAAALLPPAAAAFHDGGVAACAGCHVTHEGAGDQVVFSGDEPLLRAANPTDVCLACHGGAAGVFGPNPVLPPAERGAGNFVFLLEDNLNDAPDGAAHPIGGEAAGHSIVSLAYGTQPDSRWTYAPGGIFPSAALGCTSCHDPHGNAGFRMLHGAGPVQGGLYQFTYDAPLAEGLDPTDPLAVEARDRHTAYRAGMSDWCANCHGDYHRPPAGQGEFAHRVDEPLHSGQQDTYNLYDGASNPTGGSAATAYLPEVPFEEAGMTTDATAGPGAGAAVMCLTCHRAHASSAAAAGRWDFNVEFLDQDGMASGSWPLPNPYADPAQGSLCAKCHRSGWRHDLVPTAQ
ncbi:MAG: hypothetical protein ABR506_02060 [Candidatus Krumholzibacteriia bacterium]